MDAFFAIPFLSGVVIGMSIGLNIIISRMKRGARQMTGYHVLVFIVGIIAGVVLSAVIYWIRT